nr:pilus assembly PilX N-terminal domain-containing protein [uncultured Duganella sp.]
MKHRTISAGKARARGVALVTAIFLLVVLSGLAVAVVSLTSSQQAGAAQDEQGARAYQAARAGVEWALFVSLQRGGVAANPLACPATHSFTPPAPTLSGFTVTVACDGRAAGYRDGGPADTTAGGYTITSTACNQPVNGACPNGAPGPDYVQRQITAQL